MCLEHIPCSNDDTDKLKEHITTVHCAECHVEELVELCSKVEKREEGEEWSLEDIIEEERQRREAAEKKRAETGGLIGMLRRQLGKSNYPDGDVLRSDGNPKNFEIDCFLCQEKFFLDTDVYNKHLEKKHMITFGLKEIRIIECEEEEETWL